MPISSTTLNTLSKLIESKLLGDGAFENAVLQKVIRSSFYMLRKLDSSERQMKA